jgi:ABC-type molybdate transport system substrate-binding protein
MLLAKASVARTLIAAAWEVLGLCSSVHGATSSIEVFHADSLAGPTRELKTAFEGARQGVTVGLTSGVSKQLAERILKGETCDVFAPSAPAVIDEDLLRRPIAGSGKEAAAWYVVFSANEMVMITTRGNPLGLRRVADLAGPGVTFVRVTGEKDLATRRTIEFLKRAAALEGQPEAAEKILMKAPGDPSRPTTVPEVVRAVTEGKANAGVVYYSAAVAAKQALEILRFPASVNLSDQIRNAATIPGTARNERGAMAFIKFILSPEGQRILQATGQPPVVPPVSRGAVPAELRQ